ncbi:MAG: hypothetical protein AAF629_32800 [Chloroflexota bacterium]
MKKHFTKFFVAVALLVAVTGTGIAAEVAGFDVIPEAAAGDGCGSGNGGGGC